MALVGPIIWAEGRDAVEADIVFIHGLRGHALKTWSKGDICWPRDILPHDVPNARLISWGYDSSVVKPTRRSSQASIFDHCENLLNDLCHLRSTPGVDKRPIIFVGHSLGGLVVKEALIRASEYVSNNQHADLGAIYTCTKGVVFLGTPHRGSGKAGIAEILSGIVKLGLQHPSDRLVEVLAEDSQILERQMRSFTTISQTMPIACITEELETGIGMIVPTQSATLQGSTVKTSSVPANHMDMCRFTKAEDIGYQRVSHHIINFVRQAARDAQAKFVRELLQALAYKEMNDREDQITEAYPETFTWLLPTEKIAGDNELNPRFVDWVQTQDSSLYWLNGKAGSGKSTLMKSVFSNPSFRKLVEDWAKPAQPTFCGFFFFDRGKSILQKSRNGMMRSLLYQIIQKHRDIGTVAFPERYSAWTLREDSDPYLFEWTWEELSGAFSTILQHRDNNMRLCVFVDGLDEYSLSDGHELDADEEEDLVTQRIERKSSGHIEIAKIFLGVARANNVKLCISSRPLLRFENAFRGLRQMRLQDHTSADIATYVNGRLAQNDMMVELTKRDPLNAELLIDTIVERASGVFLWVRLVVDRLLDSLEDHDTLTEMQRTVDSLPRELGGRKGLYIRMLEDMKPAFRVQAAKYFRVVQTSRNPLSLLSLSFLELEDIESVINVPLQQLTQSEAESESKWTEGRLKSRCVGLLESIPLPPGRKRTLGVRPTQHVRDQHRKSQCIEPQIMVQFLHQTAKEFLEQDFVWDIVFNQPAMQQFNVNLALMRISVLRFKKVGLDGVDSYDRIVGAWEIIFDTLHYATKMEPDLENGDQVERLLDSLDASASTLFQDMNNTGEKSPKFSHMHWTDTEPMETTLTIAQTIPSHRTFLTLVVECGLLSYLEKKLKKGLIKRKRGILLLESAVLPKSAESRMRMADADFGAQQANRKQQMQLQLAIIELLLKDGVDPNERIPYRNDGLSVWQAFLKNLASMHYGSDLDAEIIKLLIKYGANPSARLLTGDMTESALGVVTTKYKDRHTLLTGLVKLIKAKGGRLRQCEVERVEKVWTAAEARAIGNPAWTAWDWRDYYLRHPPLRPLRGEDGKTIWGEFWGKDELADGIDEENTKLQAEINFHVQRLEELQRKRVESASSDATLVSEDQADRLRDWHL